jgi:hypothetical protein
MVGLRKAGMPEDYAVLCEFIDFRGERATQAGQSRASVIWRIMPENYFRISDFKYISRVSPRPRHLLCEPRRRIKLLVCKKSTLSISVNARRPIGDAGGRDAQ